jgi:biopolymer transport protein ExbB/TolQ
MDFVATTGVSPVGLFLQAGPVAKAVILLLLFASIWCWVLIIEGAWSIGRLKNAVAAARLRGSFTQTVSDTRRGRRGRALLQPVVEAGRNAAGLTIAGETVGEARGRVEAAMERAAQNLLAGIEGGLPNLAVISSVAPFIGLFGTVWGIMASFFAIAEAKDTSLAVVAPGIAEALAATAIGLAAAIPASVGYNRLGASLARAGQALQHLIEEGALQIATPPAGSIAAKPEKAA